jgi:peptide deformylase
MLTLMRIHKGVGLAGNQVGIDKHLVVIEAEDQIFKLANARIVKTQGKFVFREGCLSFPGLELDIQRAKKIWLEGLNEKGERIVLEVEDTLAVVFQHEIDHANGIAFIYRIPFWQRVKIYPQLRAIIKETKYALRKQKQK